MPNRRYTHNRQVVRVEEVTGKFDMPKTDAHGCCADEPESMRGYNPSMISPPFHPPSYRKAEMEALQLRKDALRKIR
jgi:hypothetical protein